MIKIIVEVGENSHRHLTLMNLLRRDNYIFSFINENVTQSDNNNLIKEALHDYTNFLLKEGYCDTDVYCEGNSAIDKFLNPKLK